MCIVIITIIISFNLSIFLYIFIFIYIFIFFTIIYFFLAVLRCLEKRIYIPLPDKMARETMFKIQLGSDNILKPFHFKELAKESEG
jgi:hypothetical protein